MPWSSLLGEFANTYQEWHYLAGGFSAGVVAGLVLSLVRRYINRRWCHAE